MRTIAASVMGFLALCAVPLLARTAPVGLELVQAALEPQLADKTRRQPEAAHAPRDASRFPGVWELVSLETRWPDGRVTEPWGTRPPGRLTYSADWHMSAVLMHEGRNQADGRTVPAEILPETAAYFGTYTIDETNHRVVHRVVGSIRANEAGAIERAYEFRGDALVLTARASRNGSPVTHVLTWKRLGP